MRTILLLTLLFVIGCFAPLAYGAGPKAEIEGFTQNKDGTSTLFVRCANNTLVTFTIKNKDLYKMDVDSIYGIIQKECGTATYYRGNR